MPTPPARPPLFALLFVAMFGCIGVTVLVFLWSGDGGFGPQPLAPRLVGSCIAVAFVAFGFGLPLAALRRRGKPDSAADADGASGAGYRCPNCGAGLGSGEVSPSGDAKCAYCDRWFNIRKA